MARLQLDLSDTHADLLDRLVSLCDRPTKKDVVENALSFLFWAATEVSLGRKIGSVSV